MVSTVLYKVLYFDVFFFNDTATTEIYTLSLHDALPIFEDLRHPSAVLAELAVGEPGQVELEDRVSGPRPGPLFQQMPDRDRKSTRLNSSHANISYAVFCLKKKKQKTSTPDNYYTMMISS